MSGQKLEHSIPADDDNGQRSLTIAVIIYAIVEALVLIPIILYTVFR